jgi:hypothetical protein
MLTLFMTIIIIIIIYYNFIYLIFYSQRTGIDANLCH